MDKEAERKQQLTAEEVAIQTYLDHPITQKIFADNAEQQESLIDLILNRPVINVETFLAREQALGHLRGLRRAKSIILDDLDEIKEEIKNI